MKNFNMRSPALKKLHELYYSTLRPLFIHHQIEITLFHCIDGINYILDVNADQYFITSLEMLDQCLSELQHAREIVSFKTNDIDYEAIGPEIDLTNQAGVGFVWGLSTEIQSDEVGYEIIDHEDGFYDLVLYTPAPISSMSTVKLVYAHSFDSVTSLKKALNNRSNWALFNNNELDTYTVNHSRRITVKELNELVLEEKEMFEALYPME